MLDDRKPNKNAGKMHIPVGKHFPMITFSLPTWYIAPENRDGISGFPLNGASHAP